MLKQEFDSFYTMEPMKYYQPSSYDLPKAKAMLANNNNGYIATWKSDGEWCRIIWDGESVVCAQSRSISKVTGEYGNKTDHIPHILEEIKRLPDGLVLLGELCYRDVTRTSKDVGGILRCLPERAVSRQKLPENKLVFKVFDCLYYGTSLMNAPYYERFLAAENAVNELNAQYVMMCDYRMGDFEDYLQSILAVGGEGIVIHDKNYLYAPGKRTAWTTMKVKKITQELELPVVATILPNRDYNGTELDSWEYWEGSDPVTKPYYYGWRNGVVVNHNGTLVRVTSGLTDADREWLASGDAMSAVEEGKLFAVVSAMEVDKVSGSLRHPRLVRLRDEVI